MPSILEKFAYSNISLEVQAYSKKSEFGQVLALVGEIEEKLSEQLNTEEKETLKRLLEAQDEVNEFTAEENFLRGYKLGVTMTAEAFVTSRNLIQ